MTRLESELNGYCRGIESFYPGCGEAGLSNSTRRYLGERLHLLTAEQRQRLFAADRLVPVAAQKAIEEQSWEQDEMNDLVTYLEQERQLEHREAA